MWKVSLDIRESFAGYIAPSYEFTNKSSSSNNFCVEFPLFGKSIAKVTPFLGNDIIPTDSISPKDFKTVSDGSSLYFFKHSTNLLKKLNKR